MRCVPKPPRRLTDPQYPSAEGPQLRQVMQMLDARYGGRVIGIEPM